jgi:hypothetical protein
LSSGAFGWPSPWHDLFGKIHGMKPEKAKQLSRLIWKQRLHAAVIPALTVLAVGVVATAFSMNYVVSQEKDTCTFVRWTQRQRDVTSTTNVIYCDLKDGKTVMATASRPWSPPVPGTEVPLLVQHRLFGMSYRIDESGSR